MKIEGIRSVSKIGAALALGVSLVTVSLGDGMAQPCPPNKTAMDVQDEPIEIVSFFARTCAGSGGDDGSDAVAAESAVCPRMGPVFETGSVGGHMVGVVLSNGELIRWSDAVAESKVEKSVYSGDVQTTWSFSNGVVITQTYDETFLFSRASTVSRVPSDNTETGSATGSEMSSNPVLISTDPKPVVKLNGKLGLQHLFFVKDDEEFELTIKNDGVLVDEAIEQDSNCPSVSAKPMLVRLEIEFSKPFFTGIEGDEFTLHPQESRALSAQLLPFFNTIQEIDRDRLYGASLALTIWTEEATGDPIFEDSFNVYRFVDAADRLHADGMIHMARTLGDGPRGVVRRRPVDALLPESAEVRWLPRRGELSVRKQSSGWAFRFDPDLSSKRRTVDGLFELRAVSDGQFAGKLRAEGMAEPKNKIDLGFDRAETQLAGLFESARDPSYARANPKDIGVHPALIPPDETSLFDDAEKRAALFQDIQKRLETLWGELFRGIELTNSTDSDNGVTVNWIDIPNTKTAHGLTPGTMDIDLPMLPDGHDHDGTDNLDTILELVKKRDQYNEGEFAYRLSEAINPNHVKEVRIFLNAILQHNLGYGRNSVVMQRDEFINTVAKVVIHEISHTMSMDHPIQAVATINVPVPNERQILVLNDGLTPSVLAQLHFKLHGGETARLGNYLGLHGGDIGRALEAMLSDSSVVGVKNWPTGASEPGAKVFHCKGTYPDQFADINAVCATMASVDLDRAYVIAFANHLAFTNIEPMILRPNYLGVLTTHTNGSATNTIKGGKADRSDFSVLAKIDENALGVSLGTLKADIMHGGFNDFEGHLAFQPKITFEALKIALALDYTLEDIERTAAYYNALEDAYTRWGSFGFNYH